jgi:hypothetical protein
MRIRNTAYEGVLVGKALLARDAAVRQLLPGRVIAQDVTCVFSHLEYYQYIEEGRKEVLHKTGFELDSFWTHEKGLVTNHTWERPSTAIVADPGFLPRIRVFSSRIPGQKDFGSA